MPDEWFRPDEEEPGPDEPRHADESESSDSTPRRADRPDNPLTTTSGSIRVVNDDTGPSVVVGHAREPGVIAVARRHRFPVWILMVAAALVVGLVLGTFITGSRDDTGAVNAAVPPASPASSVSAAMPYHGPGKPIRGLKATASCVADPAVDSEHHVVHYDPRLLVDDKPDTAWRCNGSGEGQQITLTLPQSSRIVGVGMINGYAKVYGDVDLYPQYRRVRTVRWTLPDGTWFNQDFTDDDESIQKVMISPHAVRGDITVTIVATTEHGLLGEPTRDAVLISTIQVYEED
ncbi:hypothetical protein O6R08_01550 [Cutibacterium equinum]|uniref:NAD glycohydrolase translocation F5/8 type C domain-containing protein n=1 Tax=Cutibacterium equinum TaxID=3016342 RepID=A0ABY7R116_9ACTN|nr:hypothetical protein [Cutibacterium equinum]WCC80981.1 hypothetical protein O6R08_01550 [Cutibacterium equinum]